MRKPSPYMWPSRFDYRQRWAVGSIHSDAIEVMPVWFRIVWILLGISRWVRNCRDCKRCKRLQEMQEMQEIETCQSLNEVLERFNHAVCAECSSAGAVVVAATHTNHGTSRGAGAVDVGL